MIMYRVCKPSVPCKIITNIDKKQYKRKNKLLTIMHFQTKTLNCDLILF